MKTKNEIIKEIEQIKKRNFDVLWAKMDGSETSAEAFYFLSNKNALKLKTKTKIWLINYKYDLLNFIEA